MKLKVKLNLLLSLFLVLVFAVGLFGPEFYSHAAGTTGSTGLVPCTDNCQLGDIFRLIARVINFMIGASGIYAVLRIVMGSIELITSAGNEERISGGKSTLQNAVIGLLLVFIAYAVVNTIFAALSPKVGLNSNGFLYNPFQ